MAARTNTANEVERDLRIAERLCAERGERLTDARRKALAVILASDQPVKAYDLLVELGEDGKPAKPPTAYRALEFLTKQGFVHRVETLNAYVPCLDSHSHEGHECAGPELYICDSCGHVDERHTHERAANPPTGFRLDRSVVEHYGRCAACTAA